MLLFMVLLTLEFNTCLSQPCEEAVNQNAYDTFLHRHLQNNVPETKDDMRAWQKFVDKIDTWDRPIQSFFPPSQASRVIAVCSTGGKQHTGNLCISKEPLLYFNVEVNNKKQVKKVKPFLDHHVILACNKIRSENKCLPIHFEANEDNVKPNNNNEDCS